MWKDGKINQKTRRLLYIPIIHTQVDMGGLHDVIRKRLLQRVGRTAFKRKMDAIESMWTDIERIVKAEDLAYHLVRLYQDGLPVCGREPEIVNELAKAGSRNHRLLLDLMEKGATIVGTESPELLEVEYRSLNEEVTNVDVGHSKGRRESDAEERLHKRDRFIAERINSTLQQDETGILFLGMIHSLGNLLDKDILVRRPLISLGKYR